MTENRERWLFKSRKYGAEALGPRVSLPLSATVEQRFLAKIRVTETGCWQWMGARTHGYGQFRPDRTQLHRAHRWAYKHWRGPVDDELTMDHLCQNRGCANPWHVEPVTRLENIQRVWLNTLPEFPPVPPEVWGVLCDAVGSGARI